MKFEPTEVCPKCGRPPVMVKFVERQVRGLERKFDGSTGGTVIVCDVYAEQLHLSCGCGFAWARLTLDAPDGATLAAVREVIPFEKAPEHLRR